MAISQQRQDHGSASFPWDALYCAEEQWDEGGRVGAEGERLNGTGSLRNRRGSSSFDEIKPCLLPLLLLEQDSFRVDEELLFLFSKERQQQIQCLDNVEGDASLCLARREAVEWMLKVNAYYGFSTLTAILALNYLDKFLSSLCFRKDKPWIIQLAAVTCLSLAAKVEEPQVPRLVDLQVEGTNTLFEAKTIRKMELLVLSTLEWKMNPVTPISFLDHILRRLGLKNHLHREFLRRCEHLLLSVVADSRSVSYLPSVLAIATMMHVIDQVEPFNPLGCQKQLLGLPNISKGKVNECYQLIVETAGAAINREISGLKRRRYYGEIPCSPSGAIDVYFRCESPNDSLAVASSSSVSSSAVPLLKKTRVHEQPMPLPSLSRPFVEDGDRSPR